MPCYEVQQVCENGHRITAYYNERLHDRQDFCDKCGEKTITKCRHCDTDIRGAYFSGNFTHPGSVPPYCQNCGKPFPWTENRIITAIQIFAESGKLDEKENETIEEDMNNIAKDTPKAELSAMRIKRIWGKYGKIAYGVVMDFGSSTAAKILKDTNQ